MQVVRAIVLYTISDFRSENIFNSHALVDGVLFSERGSIQIGV